jgi:hypothetical protein
VVGAEGHPPNAALAARRLGARGGHVVRIGQAVQALPFRPGAFDLVTSRHPVTTWWDEIARVLTAGGTYFSQQVGPYSVGELIEFMPAPSPGRRPGIPIGRATRPRPPGWSCTTCGPNG